MFVSYLTSCLWLDHCVTPFFLNLLTPVSYWCFPSVLDLMKTLWVCLGWSLSVMEAPLGLGGI